MATDPNKKTLRHFQCRDYLWETFEQMSGELECSVDYLINEAMRQYARSRVAAGRGPAGAMNAGGDALDSSPPARTGPPAAPKAPSLPPTATPAMPTGRPAGPPKIPSLSGVPAARPSVPGARTGGLPATPAAARGPSIPAIPGNPPPLPNAGIPRGAQGAPPPLPSGGPRLPPMPNAPVSAASKLANALTLYASFQGEQYPVTKDEFVIGRGQKTSDLVIRDSNVSRRHAIVVLHNGQYWIVDQQSTNGVEFHGAKIDRKKIEDGDVYRICDYEITFAYR